MSEHEPTFDFTRREAMVAGGTFLGASVVARRAMASSEEFSLQDVEEAELDEQGLQYFTIAQGEMVHDLAGRIYPSDDNGPGAKEVGVVFFIDRQMNQDWGQGDRWYMEGPFAGIDPPEPFDEDPDEGDGDEDADAQAEDVQVEWAQQEPAETQGWQYAMTPAEAYSYSLTAIEEYCQAEYDESFVDLDGDQQDEVVGALEEDEIDTFEAIDPSAFFLLLRENTLEGMFADPMYGGNQEMVGWRLKNFPGTPGALGSFRSEIQNEEYIEIDEPRSIGDDVEEMGLDADGDMEE
ncbi:hypothetical protein HALLA_07510 [Halostagnicola larsenii XH-48]|uniref:Gluconate 2-dehydrogenase subunit 3 n=1 Tax=Halostagnicola larsenii XH-48 TaxID=797299 RepID=W0JJC8_9EURY|nr:gluconate 2-dehydrogenase subunit 3 family protein [Halostagnicola larsenii]AHF98723.1 hypothetical protein HALLA_07510 [Halostagnicola larsenii XH-48]